MTWEFTQRPSGPANMATTSAISLGVPIRSNGASFAIAATCSSVFHYKRSVPIGPGATAFTVIFRPRNSFANTCTKPSTPAFEAI